jgi:hypothetical protein
MLERNTQKNMNFMYLKTINFKKKGKPKIAGPPFNITIIYLTYFRENVNEKTQA